MFDNRFPFSPPTRVISSYFIGTLAGTLMLVPLPAASTQGQPAETAIEQSTAASTDGGGQSLSSREIDEARSELINVKQQLVSVNKENTELKERLGAQQSANQQASGQLESARAALAAAQEQLAASQREKEKISTRLKQVQEDLKAARKLAGDEKQTVQTLRGELAQLSEANQKQAREIETLNATTDAQKEKLDKAAQEIADLESNSAKVVRERQRLESQIEKMKQETEALRLDSQQVQQGATELQTRFDALRAEIPETEGGTASEAQLRDAGAEALLRLRAQARKLRVRPSDPAVVRAYQDAVTGLAMKQQKLALATRARGLYRVRPKDTLAIVAKRNYGETGQWTQVFTANRHILDDPDRLMPDMSLVIP